MTRLELLHLLVGQARLNGFQYRRWYVTWLGLPWENSRAATKVISENHRYYALLFSREFAESFWKSGEKMTLQVPAQSFERSLPNGSTVTVSRKSFTRRSSRPTAWRYHLQKMSIAEDPLRYIRRFLRVEEELDEGPDGSAPDISLDSRFIQDEEDLLNDD